MSTAIKILIASCVLNVLGASSQECTGPLSFTNDDFTIRGPCPNDTVLVAVGSTMQYRCDYIDRTDAPDLPYWHIPKLNGTPFIAGEGSEHGLIIKDSQNGQSRDSTINIPVKDQYLNNTLSIQCGLCSIPYGCYNSGNRLIENITSTTIQMITHGPPRHLSSSIVSYGIVMFQWSRPLVSDDSVVFIYTVQLMGTTSSVILVFNTTNTYITLSRNNITDRCIEYTSWSVSVESYNNTIVTDGESISVVFQKEPSFTSEITTKVLSCSNNTLKLTFSVSSLQPLNTLDYDIWLNDTTNISYYTKHNTSSITFMDQLVQIQIPLMYITPDQLLSITVTISNECGEDTMEDVVTVDACSNITLTTTTVNNSSPSTSTQTHIGSMLTSSGHMSTTPNIIIDTTPVERLSIGQIYSGVGIAAGVVVIIIIIIIIVTVVLVIFKRRKSGSVSLHPLPDIATGVDGIDNDSPKGDIQRDIHCKVGKPNTQPTNAADTQPYLTPMDAQNQKASYEKIPLVKSEYQEPEKLKHGGTAPLTLSMERGETLTPNQRQIIEDMPGYSECLNVRETQLQSQSTGTDTTGGVPVYEDVKDAKKQQIAAGDESHSQLPVYVDVSDIQKAKKTRNDFTSYAELDLPTDDSGSTHKQEEQHSQDSLINYSTIK